MMAKESASSLLGAGTLEALGAAASQPAPAGKLPPVHLWNPPFCGDIDMRIARDGTWFYGGTPIGRPALVRLFASILRQDADGLMLVTPVEKVRIRAEDAPFLAVEMAVESGDEPVLRFRTNVDDWVTVDGDHPLRFVPGPSGGLKPYVLVRGGLEALVKRAVFLDLAERGETRTVDGVEVFGIRSSGLFFPMALASALMGPA
jgi:hypothetical protein